MRSFVLSLLLVVVTAVQPLLMAGLGHGHTHQTTVLPPSSAGAGKCHAEHRHGRKDEAPRAPRVPADGDDCTICRHLSQPTLLTFDAELAAAGDAVEPLCLVEAVGDSLAVVGLHRARSPPAG